MSEKKEKKERKPWKCPWCGKTFKIRQQATDHERVCEKRPVEYKE